MTRRRSSPLGLELVLSVVLALVVLPLLSHGAPVQESHADLQRYSEGCYYNYNHYSEGDRILTNEPCLNCTCHNKMLMCYLRVCPFTKPIGHDCTVEKREDQCCPIVTCPEVPVDIAHHNHQLTTSAPGTELSIPEKYGCSIDNKFYVEGAQVPSNPNKPCELCYCIRNRTACLMQECTLHIDGCQPIYNKGSCCPVRYNCDHENELLEIEDFSTTTTTVRPTQGYLLPSTTSPTVTTDCIHNNEVYADGASITGKNSCEHCYCMRGDIVCAVQECEMPTLESGAKTCRALPPAVGECCPSNYVCDDDSMTTEGGLTDDMPSTIIPIIQNKLHESVSQEDVQLQEHIDDKISVTEVPAESVDKIAPTTNLPVVGEILQPSEEENKDSKVEEEKPLSTTVSTIKETSFATTQSSIEHSTTYKTEEGFESSHKDMEDDSIYPPREDEIINEEKVEKDSTGVATTIAPVVGDIQNVENDEEVLSTKVPDASLEEETTVQSIVAEDNVEKEKEDVVPSKKEDYNPDQFESTSKSEEIAEKDESSTGSTIEIEKSEHETENIFSTTLASIEESEDKVKIPGTESLPSADSVSESATPVTSAPSNEHVESEEIFPGESAEKNEASTVLPTGTSEPEIDSVNFASSTLGSVLESEGVTKIPATEVTQYTDSPSQTTDTATSGPSKSHIEHDETSSESVDFSEESTAGQAESEDKIDEGISELSPEISTSSPTYEIITEGDNSHIGKPEIGDHKTESDLPKKKPKDEPEPIETIPSDVTKDEIPQIIMDTTTIHTVDSSTHNQAVDSDEETSDENTQSSVEEKPVQEDGEIPAVEETGTEDSIKPVSGDVIGEEDIIPIKDANIDKESDKEKELTTESSSAENRTTTNRPVRIHIAVEEEFSEITTKGIEEQPADSTTPLPYIVDSSVAVTEREEEDMELSTDNTSSASPVIDSEKPSVEEVQISDEQDTTMKAITVTSDAISSTEKEHLKPEKDTEIILTTTIQPSVPEQELATIVPINLETIDTEEEEVEDKPQSNIEDSTTAIPLIDESVSEHVGEEQDKIQPEDNIQSTSVPTISDSEPTIMGEVDSVPSVTEIEKDIEGNFVKVKPQYDSTEAPAVADYGHGATSMEGDSMQPVDSKITPSDSKPSEASGIEKDIEREQELDTSVSTTINSNVVDSGEPSAEEGIQETTGQEISSATTGSPINEKEQIIDETFSTISSVDESESTVRYDIEKQSEQSSTDSTTMAPPTADKSESSEDNPEEHKTPVSESVPSLDVSENEAEDKTEGVFGYSTTVSPLTSVFEGPIDEDIKKQPDQELIDSSTKSPGVTVISITDDHGIKLQETTTSPSFADSDILVPEEDEKNKDSEVSEDGFSTASPFTVDSNILSQTTDDSPALVFEEKQEIPTTVNPQAFELEQHPNEHEDAVQDKQPIDKDDVDQTTQQQDKQSSESTDDTAEGSGVLVHDIIPSAIPGEGDCLANGNTFANNATVPTSNECELSCACVNSIIVCKKVQCIEPPKPNNCVLDEASTDKCCPQYICGIDSFAENQRPTTPDEIEDEEIKFTTLPPSHKYPDISTESATSTQKPAEEKPTRQDESGNTELPVLSDENSTPLSIEEDPMSHVKEDEKQESSTKHSDEDIFVEGSTTTIQSITVKPTKQVTGDIEQPIEVTSLVPEYSIPSEKTGVTTTLTPNYQDLPSLSDIVTEQKTVIPGEEISTEGTIEDKITSPQPIKVDTTSDAPSVPSVIQTDDSTQSEETPETSDESSNESGEETDSEEDHKVPILHKGEDQKITTSRPLVSEHVGDIEPVDESTRIPEIDYEKPEMPEDLSHTKVEDETPLENDKPSKPIASGELELNRESEESTENITTTPASTILTRVEPSEEDVQKVNISVGIPDIPSSEAEQETFSSTNTPVKMEEELDSETVTKSMQEETETQTSLPLPAVSEDESSLTEDQTLSQTIAPVYDDEKPIASTISPDKYGESSEHTTPSINSPAIDDTYQTLAPLSSHESSEENEKIPSHTSEPALDDHKPTSSNEYDIKNEESPHTLAPTIEEQSIEGSGAPDSEHKSDIEQNEVLGQTSDPTTDKQPPTSDLEENKIDIITPAGVEEQSVEVTGVPVLGVKSEQDDIISQTSAPGIDKQPSTSDVKDEINIDDPNSPSIEDHSVEGSGAPISEDKTDVEQDEIARPTTASIMEKQPPLFDLQENNKTDVTSSPAAEEESGATFSEDETDVEHDKIVGQTTTTPDVEKQPSSSDLNEENKIDVTSSPAVEEHLVEGSGAPISEDKTDDVEDELVGQTTVPIIEKQPSISDLEESNKSDVTSSPPVEEGVSTPISEDKTDIEKDEIVDQTSTSAIEKQPSTSNLEEENNLDVTSSPVVQEHSVEGSGAPISEDKTDVVKDEIASQTPSSIEKQPPISDLENENESDLISSPAVIEVSGSPVFEDKTDIEVEDVASQTSTPVIDKQDTISHLEDINKLETLPAGQEYSVEDSSLPTPGEVGEHKEQIDTQTREPISEEEFIKTTSVPISEEDAHSVIPITITMAQETESEEEMFSQTNAPTVNVSSSEEESNEEKTSTEIQSTVPSHVLNDKIIPPIPTSQTIEKETHDSTSPSEVKDIVSENIATIGGDKTELPEDKKPTDSAPISGEETEFELTTVSTDVIDESLNVQETTVGSIPTIETIVEDVNATDAPSKDTPSIVPGNEYLGASESLTTSSPVKSVDEEIESIKADKTSSTIIPIESADVEEEILGSTELPSSSTPTKPIKSNEEDATAPPQLGFNKTHTSEEALSAESEPASPVTDSSSKLDDEVFSQTQAPVSSDSNASEEVSHTEEENSDEKLPIDKTLLTTESALPLGETVIPSFGSEMEESDSIDKSDQITTDKPLTQTKQPELIGEETSTKAKDEFESTNPTEMPDTISSHEINKPSGKPESDDQILIVDTVTAKPPTDIVPVQTESSADGKKPSLEESQTTTQISSMVDILETNEHRETLQPVEEESLQDTESKTPKPVSQTEVPAFVSSEQDVSSEEAKPEDVDKITNAKPTDKNDSMESQEDSVVTKTTSKPTEEVAPITEFEEDDTKNSSTVAPVDQQPITSSPVDVQTYADHTYSSHKSDEEHTDAPKDDIQTIGEFITERVEDRTTALPNEQNTKPTSAELPETIPPLTEEEVEKDKPEVSITTESTLPNSSSEATEEKTQLPEVSTEIAVDDTKPQVQPVISTEDSEEKTQAPEIISDISDEVHKPQVQETESVDESEETTQAPEIQPEITEEDHKQHVQPIEGAITSSTSENPILPSSDEKIDSDLPKPIATDEQPISEDGALLSTTIHPLFSHTEQDRTTSTPKINATDKVDHNIPASSPPSISTTDQPTSQAITNPPTTHYQPPGYGQVPPQYPSYTEDEYTDEDETEVFGPGTCRYGGKLFVSAQQIPRDDPCDFCFCFRSDIICLQQSCPPPISGCHEEPISGFCCPRYECPVSMATTLNITTSTTTTSTTLPPHFLHHAYRGAAAKNGCHISGKSYKVGDKIDSASGPCMHCTCGGDGQMKCDPKTCSPEPMLRQMIAVVASRRR